MEMYKVEVEVEIKNWNCLVAEVEVVEHIDLIQEMKGEEEAVVEVKMKMEVAMVMEMNYCYLPFHFFLLIYLFSFVW